jgi:hypothetical protein
MTGCTVYGCLCLYRRLHDVEDSEFEISNPVDHHKIQKKTKAWQNYIAIDIHFQLPTNHVVCCSVFIAVCKTLGTAATSLLFEHNARARVFGLFLDNHCMDPLRSLIKSEPFYYMQVLVMRKSTICCQIITSISVPSREVFELLHNHETQFRQVVHTRDIVHPPRRS